VKHRVFFRPAAEQDLIELYAYIAADSGLVRAGGFIDRIEAACLQLEIFPERGRLREELAPGIRILGFERRVTIAFRVQGDQVEILRIFYGGRDFETALSEER